MKSLTLVAIFLFLAVMIAPAEDKYAQPGSKEWREFFDPPFIQPTGIPADSGLRKILFDQLRPHIEAHAKRPVKFDGALKAFKNWALFVGYTVDAKGNPIPMEPMDNADTVGLWLRTREGWQLVNCNGGHSDMFYVIWPEVYGVPKKLICGNEELCSKPNPKDWHLFFDPPFAKPTQIAIGSELRKTLFDKLRPQIERETKRPVQFVGDIRAFKNWALFVGYTQDKHGNGLPEDGGDTAALWLRTANDWKCVDYFFGVTDAAFLIWSEKYGAPKELVGSL